MASPAAAHSSARLPLDTQATWRKVLDLQDEWYEYLSSGRLTEFITLLMSEGVYQRYTDADGLCKSASGKCFHEGLGCLEWTKPLWFECLALYIAQIGEFHKLDTPENERQCILSEEIFGVKAYIRST
jgi:hypothetical protein